jgi:hypothetical protein
MRSKLTLAAISVLAVSSLSACATDGASGGKTAALPTGGASTGTSIPSLVNVNLSNVLNDLSVKLNLDRANVPVTIQLPVTLAANVCGVSVNVLAVSTGGQANCTAKTDPPELAQVVQQQMAAGGNVGGGAQGGSNATTGGAPTGGASTGGSAGAGGGLSTGGTDNTTTTAPATTTKPAG